MLEFPTMNRRPLLVLASNSPRRKELLSLGGLAFEVIVSNADESRLPSERAGDYVRRLAETKARDSARHAEKTQIILAADTSVVDGNEILGKPADPEDAKRMLRQLGGHSHQVYTGIAALRVRDGLSLTDVCITDVPMRDYSEAEIESYVASGDPLDKAGAYAIQHPEFQPVAEMKGCYASVMGLPLCHVTRLLEGMELPPSAEIPNLCQAFLHYDCPVFAEILNRKANR